MVSIILLIYNRPQLTLQTLNTLFASLKTSSLPHEVIVVDNDSDQETKQILHQFEKQAHLISLHPNQGVAGGKNAGVKASRGDWLYLSDNDMYFLSGWLDQLHATTTTFPQAKIIGSFRHPYHGIIKTHKRQGQVFEQLHQAVGSTWFLSRDTWDTFGPLDEGLEIGKDDVKFCDRVTQAGFWVGASSPYQVIHCGATNSDGEPSPGAKDWAKNTDYRQQLPKGAIIQ